MAKLVFVLGAGASVGATAKGDAVPSQASLLTNMLSHSASTPNLILARKLIVAYLRAMYPGPGAREALTFEEVVGPLEWLESRQSSCHVGAKGMRNARTIAAFDTLLAFVLSNPRFAGHRVFRGKSASELRKPSYDAFYNLRGDSPNTFAQLAFKLSGVQWPCAFVSFNYDLLLDRVLLHESSSAAIDYAIPSLPLDSGFTFGRPHTVRVIKPHGSINWSWCTRCHQLTVFGSLWVASGKDCRVCRDKTEADRWPDGSMRTLLLRPSIFKERTIASEIWERLIVVGKTELSEADYWIFVGYSFPSADVWVRSWLREAEAMKRRRRRVIVVDPSADDSVVGRYRSFFGNDVVHLRQSFWDFVREFEYEQYRGELVAPASRNRRSSLRPWIVRFDRL